jgi:tricorn protease-like protein/C-terminal processing protease CtpA/Prc
MLDRYWPGIESCFVCHEDQRLKTNSLRHTLRQSSARFAMVLASAAGIAMSLHSVNAEVKPTAGMLRWPDVGPNQIVFSYANDLWLVPKSGGVASKLSSPAGVESFPKFSPDGKTIAFVGNYEGNTDLYTVPVDGGSAQRVTHHPAGEVLNDWTPAGFQGGAGGQQLLFLQTGRTGLGRQSRLFSVPAVGGLPTPLPVPYAGFGTISPNGEWLAYTLHSTDTRTWKRYRGGMATEVWLFNLKDHSSKQITNWEGTDTIPMFVPPTADGKGGSNDIVYYLSDQGTEHRLNVWSYDVKTQQRTQVTKFTEDDIRWPSIGPGGEGKGEIVFQLGSELRLLDLATGKDIVVNVTIPGDRPTVRPKTLDAGDTIQSYGLSPTGKRVIVSARGDVWSLPSKDGTTRNLTRTDGVFERFPSYSPDGKLIAYFSDESGEYELYVRASDARPEEKKDEKKDDKKDEAKPEAAKGDEKKDESKADESKAADTKPADTKTADTKADAKKADAVVRSRAFNPAARKLTNLGPGFRANLGFSPDSKTINFTDNAGNLYLTNVETGETKIVDRDTYGNTPNASWSSDSAWVAYTKSDEVSGLTTIWLYNVKAGTKTRVTSGMFDSNWPAFDRKGDFLYFSSARNVTNPIYGDIGQDTTWVYAGSELLYAIPLRNDVKSPYLPKSDEEEFKPDAPKEEKKSEKKDDAKKDESKKDEADKPADKKDEPKQDEKPTEKAVADDGVSGSWSGTASGGPNLPPGGIPLTFILRVSADGSVAGSIVSAMGSGDIQSGKFDKAAGTLTLTSTVGGQAVTIEGKIAGSEFTGTWAVGGQTGSVTARRTAGPSSSDKGSDGKSDAKGDKDKPKEVKIDLEGLERRAIQLPVAPGGFYSLNVSHDNKLIFVRRATPNNAAAGIKIFDINDDKKEEKQVTAGGGYDISADGKKLGVLRGKEISVMDTSAGGGTATSTPAGSMRLTINPREEWKQIFTETWRQFRDYFYEPTMHGVDWNKMRQHYGAMIDDASTREDVAWITGELMSELNVGHAYVWDSGDVEEAPQVGVGMLAADYELTKTDQGTAYKITRIYQGADWDVDARGPLSQPGVDVKVGDYLLAVNGAPVDTSKDPWAAFIATATKPTTLTVSERPVLDEKARDVVVTPAGSEAGMRYRAWVEARRKYVSDKTDGKVGYIYVPNTGVDGQNELVRQFYGQKDLVGLIIDDRWNGGGQIPTRFIELLNRPVTNFWVTRHGPVNVWPPDGSQTAKVMLINGLAGSGGDAFPTYFRDVGLGKLIGTRTWGGLVGIGGYPPMIDGGSVRVPSFAYVKKNGTWSVEGHGVDPDIEVIDDPAKMVGDGKGPIDGFTDVQLDVAIEEVLKQAKAKPFVIPPRPASPNRSGMGIPPEQR